MATNPYQVYNSNGQVNQDANAGGGLAAYQSMSDPAARYAWYNQNGGNGNLALRNSLMQGAFNGNQGAMDNWFNTSSYGKGGQAVQNLSGGTPGANPNGWGYAPGQGANGAAANPYSNLPTNGSWDVNKNYSPANTNTNPTYNPPATGGVTPADTGAGMANANPYDKNNVNRKPVVWNMPKPAATTRNPVYSTSTSLQTRGAAPPPPAPTGASVSNTPAPNPYMYVRPR